MIGIKSKKKNTIYDENLKNEISADIKSNLDNYDVILLSKLNNLKDSLSLDRVNMSSIKQQIKEINDFDKSQNFMYLNTLLHPEKSRGCKIPSQVPVPSCAFQLHNCVTVSTNSSGCVAVMFNPFFLASEELKGGTITSINMPRQGVNTYVGKYLSSLWVNNDNSLTGFADNDKWHCVDISQMIPPVYESYRLVSASLVVKYIGRLDQVQGQIGGAVIYDDIDSLGGNIAQSSQPYEDDWDGVSSICPQLAKYGNFDYIMDSYYHHHNGSLEGLRELYFPIDNSYEDYVKCMTIDDISGYDYYTTAEQQIKVQLYGSPAYYKKAFNWCFYGISCPPNTNCFKIDIYCNFECLPKAKFLSYMPISINPYMLPAEEKRRQIMAVQSKPILREDEEGGEGVLIPSLFARMIRKFGHGLPCFDQLRQWGLIQAVPGLTSGLALAGAMMQAQNSMVED